MGIPGRYLLITDGPFDAIPKTRRVPELIRAPPRAGPSPDQRLDADLVTPDPVKGFLLDIRLVFSFNKQMRSLPSESRSGSDQRIFLHEFSRHLLAMWKLPGRHRGR